ncbi:hypothetical protein DERP_003347 [Dermatophagoides pteronyssinus]|uniref:Uncharacterized protein n=1 Tax=Dermatophagoides pteronyssinus TaxID=6956 RepID=A0ABQ8JJT3_DERPT|nr:hypothetical protein DERP_003347 [Dermatophagoides pteronyssinus]
MITIMTKPTERLNECVIAVCDDECESDEESMDDESGVILLSPLLLVLELLENEFDTNDVSDEREFDAAAAADDPIEPADDIVWKTD